MTPIQRTAAAVAIQENIETTLGAGIQWAGIIEADHARQAYAVNALTVGGRNIPSDAIINAGEMTIHLVSHPISIITNVAGRPDAIVEVMSAPARFEARLIGEEVYDLMALDLNDTYGGQLIADAIACRAARNPCSGADQSRWLRALMLTDATRDLNRLPTRVEFSAYLDRLLNGDLAETQGLEMESMVRIARLEPIAASSREQIAGAITRYRDRFAGGPEAHLAGRPLRGIRAMVEVAHAGLTPEILAQIRTRVEATTLARRPAVIESTSRAAPPAAPVVQPPAPTVEPARAVVNPSPISLTPPEALRILTVEAPAKRKKSKGAKAEPKEGDDLMDAFSF